MIKQASLWLLGILAVLALMWLLTGNSFFIYKWLAPRTVEVQRQTFEQSKAYNQGMVQDLSRLYEEFVHDTPVQRQALGAIIRERFADYVPTQSLPTDLRNFLDSLRRNP